MRRVTLNLASRPFVNRMFPLIVVGALGICALSFTAANLGMLAAYGGDYRQLRALVAEQEDQIASHRQTIVERKRVIQAATDRIFTEEALFVDEILRQRAFSWSRFLARLEAAKAFGTMFRTVSPSIDKEGRIFVSIRAVANPRGEMLQLEKNLFESPYFRDVKLEEEGKEPKEAWTEFSVIVEYLPEAPAATEPVPAALVYGPPFSGDPSPGAGPAVPAPEPASPAAAPAPVIMGPPLPVDLVGTVPEFWYGPPAPGRRRGSAGGGGMR